MRSCQAAEQAAYGMQQQQTFSPLGGLKLQQGRVSLYGALWPAAVLVLLVQGRAWWAWVFVALLHQPIRIPCQAVLPNMQFVACSSSSSRHFLPSAFSSCSRVGSICVVHCGLAAVLVLLVQSRAGGARWCSKCCMHFMPCSAAEQAVQDPVRTYA
jgi:hypothetical protein